METIKVMHHFTGKYRLLLGDIRISITEKKAKEIMYQYGLKSSSNDTMGSTIYFNSNPNKITL